MQPQVHVKIGNKSEFPEASGPGPSQVDASLQNQNHSVAMGGQTDS